MMARLMAFVNIMFLIISQIFEEDFDILAPLTFGEIIPLFHFIKSLNLGDPNSSRKHKVFNIFGVSSYLIYILSQIEWFAWISKSFITCVAIAYSWASWIYNDINHTIHVHNHGGSIVSSM